jgi:hypothetical protein
MPGGPVTTPSGGGVVTTPGQLVTPKGAPLSGDP